MTGRFGSQIINFALNQSNIYKPLHLLHFQIHLLKISSRCAIIGLKERNGNKIKEQINTSMRYYNGHSLDMVSAILVFTRKIGQICTQVNEHCCTILLKPQCISSTSTTSSFLYLLCLLFLLYHSCCYFPVLVWLHASQFTLPAHNSMFIVAHRYIHHTIRSFNSHFYLHTFCSTSQPPSRFPSPPKSQIQLTTTALGSKVPLKILI